MVGLELVEPFVMSVSCSLGQRLGTTARLWTSELGMVATGLRMGLGVRHKIQTKQVFDVLEVFESPNVGIGTLTSMLNMTGKTLDSKRRWFLDPKAG